MSGLAVYKDITMWDEARRQPSKYRSLPELQLRSNGQPIFHCSNRGLTNVDIPRCTSWASSHDAGHASGPSLPRVRHASAPVPVFFQFCLHRPRRHQPHDDSWGVGKKSLGQKWRQNNLLSHSRRETNAHNECSEDIDLRIEQSKSTRMFDVATVTPLASDVEPSHNSSPGELEQQSSSELDCEQLSGLGSDSGSNSLPASMTVKKHPKAFRRQLVIDFEHKTRQSFNNDDNEPHEFQVNHINLSNEVTPPSPIPSIPPSPISPRHSQLRTIRRKRRLSIVRMSPNPEEGAVKPITISLTLDPSGTAQQKVASASVCAPADVVKKDPTLKSITTSDLVTCPSPARPPISEAESATPPAPPSNLTRLSTPNVRLGHPTRPYYSAIRKQGISPPSSRPSSVGTPAPTSPSIRPKSYSPPSPPPHKSVPSSSANRHWSMSAMPPSPSGVLSVFSLDENDLDDEEDIVELTPTKAALIPSRLSFGVSFASAAKSLSRKRSASLGFAPSTFSNKRNTHKQSPSISCPPFVSPLSAAAQSPYRGSLNSKLDAPASEFGFSVSGETELKMALALAEVQGGIGGEDNAMPTIATTTAAVDEDVFSSTTPFPPLPPPFPPPVLPSLRAQTNVDTNVRKSLASRVKKLRKGLKGLLVTASHGNDR